MNAVDKLRQMVAQIQEGQDPRQVQADWELVERLLTRMPADQDEAARVCQARDIAGLDALVKAIEHPESAQTSPGPDDDTPADTAPAVSHDDMKAALRAFHKRMKLMRLSDESKLGGRQMTSGRKSAIDAIMPPHEFPREVWQALAREGKLIDTGRGFYAEP